MSCNIMRTNKYTVEEMSTSDVNSTNKQWLKNVLFLLWNLFFLVKLFHGKINIKNFLSRLGLSVNLYMGVDVEVMKSALGGYSLIKIR